MPCSTQRLSIWNRQLGSADGGSAYGSAVSVDAAGDAFVAGSVDSFLPGETSAGVSDAYVSKYQADGSVLWTRQFGTANPDYGQAVHVVNGDILAAGITLGAFPGQTHAGSEDAFIVKFSAP